MVAAEAIKNVGRNLVTSIREPENIEAMSCVAFGSYLSGIQMTVGTCTSAHPLEHALSAYHENLPHGAGLIMISKAYYSFFIDKHVCDDRFVEMAKLMGMEDARDFLWRSRFAMIKNSKKRRNSHYDKKKNNADYGLLCYFCYIASAIQTVF